MKYLLFIKVVTALSFLFFIASLLFFLQNDFWQDEVYTLFHFVFVPTKTTLSDYHSTNNHVLFNLINNLVRQIFGFQKLADVLLHPYFLRCVPVIFSISSVCIFFKKCSKAYDQHTALICTSILITTFPFLCFAAQFRGYSLAIFIITLQYFSFIKQIKKEKLGAAGWLRLCTYTSFSLLCLPTNIYIELAYLLLLSLFYIKPLLSQAFFSALINRKKIIFIISAIATGCLWVNLYYKWVLQLQPQNPFITTFHLFSFPNLLQAIAVPYHFSGYRLYFLFPLVAATIVSAVQFKKSVHRYQKLMFPLFLLFLPFVFFFIHGCIIIPRTFLSLLPFFALLVGLSIRYFSTIRYYSTIVVCIFTLNLICVTFSFIQFVKNSKHNNVIENHVQGLKQHYYLIHFNALPSAIKAKSLVEKSGVTLYLFDGFGQTGIDYYLHEFKIPFVRYNDTIPLPDRYAILTNLKIEIESKLKRNKVNYTRFFNRDEQYNIYLHITKKNLNSDKLQ